MIVKTKKIFNKLIRDKIPEILEKKNILSKTRILDNKEYLIELRKKLKEETKEFFEANGKEEIINELVDVLEIIEYLALTENITWEKLMIEKNNKKDLRGGFKKKLFLEYTEE